ncbi:acyl-CoA dehydrogenase family protein [soil metagenome]
MDFSLTDEHVAIRTSVERLCADFTAEYWLEKDRHGGFPVDFHRAVADAGLIGVAMPTEYGGSGLGLFEAALIMQTIARSGAGFSGASAVHVPVFGLHPIVSFASHEQKLRWIPPAIDGSDQPCFAVTEPNTGLETLKLKTLAVRQGDRYVVRGQKVWISTAQVANKIMLLARTTPLDQVTDPKMGLSLFYTDFDRATISAREIEKLGRKAVDSNELFIDGLNVPIEDRIGEEGRGFEYVLNGLNPERILVGAEAVGLGYAALDRAAAYANERVVFGRPIGKNQGIQHPLAERWIELEAANLLCQKAAWLYDNHLPCGPAANAAKYFGGEAGFRACETSLLTHGGMGFAKEFHVERYFREAMLPRIAPVSSQLVLSFIAERALGLPKSY